MDLCENRKSKFKLGKVLITKTALKVLEDKLIPPITFLRKHQSGNWGQLCDEDWKINEEAIAHEGDPEKQQRVFSSYKIGTQTIWIITEHNRETTTLLTPEDY